MAITEQLQPPEQHQQNDIPQARNDHASGSDSEADHTDDSNVTASRSSKKRKRNLKISCELCKARKVRCDRAEPSCGWCTRNNRMCVYSERKKPGVRIAYVQELEDKVNRLEAVLHSLGRRVEDHIAEHDFIHQKHLALSANHDPVGLTTHSEIPRSSYAESSIQASPTVDSQWPVPSSYGREQPMRASEPIPTPSIVGTESSTVIDERQKFSRPRAYTASTSTVERLPPITDAELPPYDLVYNLVDLFFKHINPWSPVLDRKSTFDSLFSGSGPSEDERILLHAIVATTLRFSQDSRLTPLSRKQYHDASKRKILLQVVTEPTIHSLQALLILAIDIVGTSHCPQGLNLIALLARNIVQLELGVEKSIYLGPPSYPAVSSLHTFAQSQPQSWIEDEGRRRLVWMVYTLDRYSTVSDCSSFVLPDSSIHRRLPTTYDLFSRNVPITTRWPRVTQHTTSTTEEANLGSFSYHCEVLTILSRVHNFLKSPIDLSSAHDFASWRTTYQSLDSELNTWLQSLPGEYGKISQLCHSDPGSKISNWIMLHAAFVTAVIRLHSAAAYPTISSSTASHSLFRPSYNAMQRCLGAVESLREIAQDTINNSMLDLLGPPFAFSLWTSARLLLVHAATDGALDPKIRFFISTLSAMGTYWEIASTYAETLSRVVDEGQQNAHSFGGNNMANSSTTRSFKEMRKSAYELSLHLNQKQEESGSSKVHTPSPNELEYLDVFDFFNYPLIAVNSRTTAPGNSMAFAQSMVSSTEGGVLLSPHFAMPTRESDWLNFQPPHE